MVKLTIDGTELQVKDGTTILDAALQAGIHIPTLCYLKKLNKIGACRVCMVEVEGNEMDLSMIFGDSDVNFKDENADSMPTSTNPDIEQVKATTINQPGKALASMQNGGPYEEMEVTDHSIKAHGGISRKPASRLPPTYRGSEAYSDFLKKTKSVFYRIKWSLFKE